MDDGITLNATIAFPADPNTGQPASGTFPVILMLSPYTDEPDLFFAQRGYIFATVRPRGSGASGGEMDFLAPRDARDGVEVVDWMAHQLKGSNGIIGGYGCSYAGFTQLATAAVIGPNSPLKTIIAACSGGDWIRESHLIGGIPTESLYVLGNLDSLTGDTNGYFANWLENVLSGGDFAYDGPYWEERNYINVADKIAANEMSVLIWVGWKDIEVKGLEMYAGLQNALQDRSVHLPMDSNQPASGRYQIIVDPCGHGQCLDDTIMLEWYDTWLKDVKTNIEKTQTPMHLFEGGSSRWINTARYPVVPSYATYYFGSGGTLTTRPSGVGSDAIQLAQPGTASGTLAYTTEAFSQGATVAGPVSATVYASSTNTNLVLIATLYDVAPDNTVTPIDHGTLLGSQSSLRESYLHDGASWYDETGVVIRPFPSQIRDDYLTPGKLQRFDIGLLPNVWSVAPDHSLSLVLTTQTPQATCDEAKTTLILQSDPCYLTAPQLRTVPNGVYEIQRGGQTASSVHLPLLPYLFFPTALSGTTPTSNGASVPLYWGPEGGRQDVN
jgi:predicted acyl esterase